MVEHRDTGFPLLVNLNCNQLPGVSAEEVKPPQIRKDSGDPEPQLGRRRRFVIETTYSGTVFPDQDIAAEERT
jgi:hypothetical protein